MTDHAQDDVEAVAKAVEKAEWDNLELTVAEIRKAQAVAALAALAQRGLYTALDLLKHTTQIRMERDAALARASAAEAKLEAEEKDHDDTITKLTEATKDANDAHRCWMNERTRAASAEAEVARMREALTWYASPGEPNEYVICQRDAYGRLNAISPLTLFCDRARAALAAKETTP